MAVVEKKTFTDQETEDGDSLMSEDDLQKYGKRVAMASELLHLKELWISYTLIVKASDILNNLNSLVKDDHELALLKKNISNSLLNVGEDVRVMYRLYSNKVGGLQKSSTLTSD